MSFIGPALMTILANTLLPMYMDKHANGLTLPGHSRDSPPFGSSREGRPRDVHFSHPWMAILIQLNACSWHTQQDRRDGLTIRSSNAELCFGASSNTTTPIAIQVSDPIATSIEGKDIKFFV